MPQTLEGRTANRGGTAKKDIYTILRSQILNGIKKPGERLAIDSLKSEFGTSVTPVRDALQMLNQEALVTIKPRSGYFVAKITLKELRDMLDLREILELAAVERAAMKISEEQINGLRAVHAGYTGEDDSSYTRYTDENRNFHCMVAEASENSELVISLSRLLDRLGRFMVIRHAGHELQQLHEPLIERLEAHDVDGAKKALMQELTETRIAIMERVMHEEAAFWHLGGGSSEQ
ncbi:Transcriptional regulator [Desulfamplus magnetovallimortis]|uniref:Transcriptional regulator n=2 Tax=Desulfamplus magnetovallimortis TaxID=1246637 RepID=A0A1W1H820_9BACT|nr:Transcriptional regulator [Desulfamplus magnetovallimortis]